MFIVYINCLHGFCQPNITSSRLTVVPYAILETDIFCHKYSKMNNSAMRYYFLAKFGGSFTNIFRNICIQFCQDLFRFVIFCRTLSSELLLFRTRCISCDLLKLCATARKVMKVYTYWKPVLICAKRQSVMVI